MLHALSQPLSRCDVAPVLMSHSERRGENLQDALEVTGRWRRQFLYSSSFRDVDHLLQDVVTGGPARLWVDDALSLRYHSKNRYRAVDVVAALATGHTPKWLRDAKPQLWALYTVQRGLCVRQPVVENPVLRNMTRRQRKALAGHRVVRHRRRSAGVLAAERLDDLRVDVGRQAYVMWLDNYSKQRYSRNPNERRNDSVNGTAYAVWPLHLDLDDWDGWPSLQDLFNRIPEVCRMVGSASRAFGDDIRGLLMSDLRYADIRVPCDRRRMNVQSLNWYPYSIEGCNIGSMDGLAVALQKVVEVGWTHRCLSP